MRRGILSREFFLIALPAIAADIIVCSLSVIVSTHFILDHFEYDALNYLNGHELRYGLPTIAALSMAIVVAIMGVRSANRMVKYRRVALRAFLIAVAYAVVDTILVGVVFDIPLTKVMLLGFAMVAVAAPLIHLALVRMLRHLRSKGHLVTSTVVVGTDQNALDLYSFLSISVEFTGYDVAGIFGDRDRCTDEKWLGKAEEAADYVLGNGVDELYCSLSPVEHSETVSRLIQICQNRFIKFYYVPNMDGYVRRRFNFEEIGSVNVARLREEPLSNPISKFVKRSFDIVISGLFLITLYPLIWAVVAVGIKLSSPGPILFRQKRTGYSGHSFDCLKFRSMKVNTQADTLQATENDPRKTKFGDFLRRSSIDELPQFINVFRGDMSIIGPRPHMEYHTQMYSELISEYLVRHLVKPGITGWAQVNGFRGETKTLDQMKNRVDCDIWYIEHWTLFLDIKIFFLTVRQILGGDKQAF